VHWKEVYPTCGAPGQSPINLPPAKPDKSLLPLQFARSATCSNVTFHNNGNTWKVIFSEMCQQKFVWNFEGEQFLLEHVELHSPSEHRIGGGLHDAEFQLYHRTAAGRVAVLSIMARSSLLIEAENEFFKAMTHGGDPWKPKEVLAKELDEPLRPYQDLMPASPEYFTYYGSYTVPPCAKPVTWVIQQEAVRISYLQLAIFRDVMYWSGVWKGNNNRPVQALGGRQLRFFAGDRSGPVTVVTPTTPMAQGKPLIGSAAGQA